MSDDEYDDGDDEELDPICHVCGEYDGIVWILGAWVCEDCSSDYEDGYDDGF